MQIAKPLNQSSAIRRALGTSIITLSVLVSLLATPANGYAASLSARAQQRLAPIAQGLLKRIAATPAQRRALVRLSRKARVHLDSHAKALGVSLQRVDAIFSADKVDPAKVEALRVKTLQALQDSSAWTSGWLAEVANTLTPKQRRILLRSLAQPLM